jgi:hypothetical protein
LNKQETNQGKDPIITKEVEDSLLLASYLAPGERFCFQTEEGKNDITRKELKELETMTGRRTIDSTAPIPIYLDITRREDNQEILTIFRYSQTLNNSEAILQISRKNGGINRRSTVEITPKNLNTINKLINQLKDKVLEKIDKEPNFFSMSQKFSTTDEKIRWKSLKSLKLRNIPSETKEKPHRRLYVNIDFNQTDYLTFMKKLSVICRKYDKPLYFKALYDGKGIDDVVKDPYHTKIVFYFAGNDSGKKSGEEFASFLSNTLLLQNAPVGRQNEKAFLGRGGRSFCGDRLLFAKGTKEDREHIFNMVNYYSHNRDYEKLQMANERARHYELIE